MRYARSILIFLATLAICGLIGVSLVMQLRAPQGPDLGTPEFKRGGQMGASEKTRLWYSGSILGRWSESGRCQSEDETWIFARRRVIQPEAICEISRFVPGAEPGIDLHRCKIKSPDDTASTANRRGARMRLSLQSDTELSVSTTETVELIRCQ